MTRALEADRTAAERAPRYLARGPVSARVSDEELARRCATGHDRRAAEVLLERYRPLARRLARRYSRTSEPQEDLAQVACVAFIAALARFDPARGATLRSFAIPTMLGELRRHFRDTAWSVHVPRILQERARAVRLVVDELSAGHGRSPTLGEIGSAAGLSTEEVVEALEVGHAYRAEPLELPDDDDGDPRRIRERGYDDNGFARAEDRVVLGRALDALSERERTIVELRFRRELSQSEIGRILGISQMHVSRLLRRALERMERVVRSGSDTAQWSSR